MRRLALLVVAISACTACGDNADAPVAEEHKLQLRINRHGGVYMGVRCRVPNSVSCDRIGLAVWLAQPAKRLTAKIEGRPLTLEREEWARPRESPWVGYLQPAGLLDPGGSLAVAREPGQPADYWSGVKPVDAKIRLTAAYADGTTASKTIRAPLHPGWG